MGATSTLRIGIAGCGRAARIHVGRLLAIEDVCVVGCADTEIGAARALAAHVASDQPGRDPVQAFADHRELLARTSPDAIAVFTPHNCHYRPAVDALQAGCHVFVEKPLSTNAQEAADIVGLARGRRRKVGVGHQYRLCPSFVEARRRLAEGHIGPLRLVTGALSQPWLEAHNDPEDSWRLGPQVLGGGILADAGDHLIDALLWTSGRAAVEAAAFQTRVANGLDVATAVALRFDDGVPASVSISGVSPAVTFELTYYGESGWLRATESNLIERLGSHPESPVSLPEQSETIDGNFINALLCKGPLCCPADGALETVRLLEAVHQSAATGQVVRLA
jgi:predicted dehydrogenase